MGNPEPTPRKHEYAFRTTQWSAIVSARSHDSKEARAGLQSLCQTYWYPLYAFARRWGCVAEDAQDAVQGFFNRFIEKDYLSSVDASKGRFRSFLLTSFKHFLNDEKDRQQALKRGGNAVTISLDALSAESRYSLEPVDNLTAENIYHRRWADVLVSKVFERLEQEYQRLGKGERCHRLIPFILNDPEPGAYETVAAELKLSESGVRTAVQRLRQRFGDFLHQEVELTVMSPDEVQDELQHLLRSLSL